MSRAVRIAVVLLAGPGSFFAQDPGLVDDAARFVGQWCVSCHGGAKPASDFDLSRFPGSFADPDRALRRCAERLRAGEMPPDKAAQPPRDQVAALLARIERAGGHDSRPGPGRVTIRRLSRYEYRNTIRDLLGVEAPADDFPVDDVGYGFDNIGDVLSISPLLFDKYAAAAEQIAGEAILAEDPDRPRRTRIDGKSLASTLPDSFRGSARVLFKSGQATAGAFAPRAGDYVLRVRAYGDQAGPEKVRMILGADGGSPAVEVEVAATKDAPEEYETRSRLKKGPVKVGVAFPNDYYLPTPEDPKGDRNLIVEWVEIVGPLDRIDPPPSHRAIFAADPGGPDPAARLRAMLPPFLLRAWRRPATEAEVARLEELAARGMAEGAKFERAVQLVVQAALTSPNFLFRAEPAPAGAKPGGDRDLTGFELASRLSYFLWSSMPDRASFELAAKDGLREPAALRREVRRMLADPRSSALAENFAGQWLELRNLADAAPDPGRFPDFDEDLRDAMRRETEMLFEAILRENRPVSELVDGDFTFVNERLARHYGIVGVHGTHFRRVPAPPDRGGGFLAHASVLTVTSNATRTSPVKRGKFVLDNVLDAPPPAPPPGVGALDERQEAVKATTIRERMEKHRTDPSCASCHARIDGLGFALEHYDPLGAFRLRDESAAVDASATLPDGRRIEGLAGLRQVIRDDGALVRALAKKLFTYAVGRGVDPADDRAIRAMIAELRDPDPTISDLVTSIVQMEEFRRRAH
jgi:hypothetical protein